MVDARLRPKKTELLRPVTRRIAVVRPALITAAGLVAGGMSILAVLWSAPAAAVVLWLLNRTLDGLDGEVARYTGRQTDLGGYLDIMADHVIYAALPIAIAWQAGGTPAWAAAAVLIATFYVNTASWMFLSALFGRREGAYPASTSIAMPTGLIEGTETIVLYTLMLLFPDAFVAIAGAMAVLVGFTAAQRVWWARRSL